MRNIYYICLILCLLLVACSPVVDSSAVDQSPLDEAISTQIPLVDSLRRSTPVSLPEYFPSSCRFSLPDGFRQGENVDCGDLYVAEDRARMKSRSIRLHVAIFHPPGGADFRDPIVFLSGGPGVSALELIRFQFQDTFQPILDSTGRDLIVFDQRGVGLSEPALDCPNYREKLLDLMDRSPEGKKITNSLATSEALQSLLECRRNLEEVADLSQYSSAVSSADVEDLRTTLGYETINLWGASYGSRLALEVLRRRPETLRSAILDAVYPPDVDLYAEAPANFYRSLSLLFESCAANQVCNQAYPDLRQVFFKTVDRLNRNPEMREIIDPFTMRKYQAQLTGDILLGLVFQILYDSHFRYRLPEIIYAAYRGDFEVLDQVRGIIVGQMTISSQGMAFSVQCREELAFSSVEDFRKGLEAIPELAGFFEYSNVGGFAYRVCEFWDVGKSPISANRPVSSDAPVMVMAGEFDPITPPAWALHATISLPNAQFFLFPRVGHGASGLSGCPKDLMVEFVMAPHTKLDASCLAEMAQ